MGYDIQYCNDCDRNRDRDVLIIATRKNDRQTVETIFQIGAKKLQTIIKNPVWASPRHTYRNEPMTFLQKDAIYGVRSANENG